MCHYDTSFRNNHKLSLSIMKRFGFGHRVMETRILREVEEMISKVREKQGRPFDVRQLMMSCVANVILSMAFGGRFDHSDPAFQQLISDVNDFFHNSSPALMTFPILRFIPHFKKIMIKSMSTNDRLLSFISNNVAICTQVCNYNLLRP